MGTGAEECESCEADCGQCVVVVCGNAICDESEWQMHGVFNCGTGRAQTFNEVLGTTSNPWDTRKPCAGSKGPR